MEKYCSTCGRRLYGNDCYCDGCGACTAVRVSPTTLTIKPRRHPFRKAAYWVGALILAGVAIGAIGVETCSQYSGTVKQGMLAQTVEDELSIKTGKPVILRNQARSSFAITNPTPYRVALGEIVCSVVDQTANVVGQEEFSLARTIPPYSEVTLSSIYGHEEGPASIGNYAVLPRDCKAEDVVIKEN